MAETFQDVPFSWGPAALEPSERHLLASETHLVEVLRKSELRVPWSSWAWRHDVLSYLQDLFREGMRVHRSGDGLGLLCFFLQVILKWLWTLIGLFEIMISRWLVDAIMNYPTCVGFDTDTIHMQVHAWGLVILCSWQTYLLFTMDSFWQRPCFLGHRDT